MKKHNFVPEHVSAMEQRALLSGGFKFPGALGGSNTLGFKGAHVLTSRTYANVQQQINTSIQQFNKSVIMLYNREGFSTTFDDRIGIGTLGQGANAWSYKPRTFLAALDARIASLEFKLPYGGGLGANNPTGGAGLSNRTALTSLNPGLGNPGVDFLSVAQQMEQAVYSASSKEELQSNLEQVRIQTLSGVGGGQPGVLPSYIAAFGPRGARDFGLKNS